MKACFQIAERSLFYVKTVPARAMKACFQIAERSLFYSKTVPARAMKACFQIAECSLFYSKTVPASAMRPCFQIALFGQACIKKAAGQVRSASPSIPSGMCRCVRFPAPQSCKRLPCGFIHRCRLSSRRPPSSCGCP